MSIININIKNNNASPFERSLPIHVTYNVNNMTDVWLEIEQLNRKMFIVNLIAIQCESR